MQRYYTTMAKSSSLYSDNNSVSKCVFAYVFPLILLCILLFVVATIRAIARGQTLKDRVAKSRKGQEILRVLAPVPMLNCGHCQGVNTNHYMEICIENQLSRMPEA